MRCLIFGLILACTAFGQGFFFGSNFAASAPSSCCTVGGSPVTGSDASGVGQASIATGASNDATGSSEACWVRHSLSGPHISGIMDTAGNTYVSGTGVSTADPSGQWWYKLNMTGNATNVKTVSFSPSQTYPAIVCFNITGATAVDVINAPVTQASGATLTSAMFTTCGTCAKAVIFFGGAEAVLSETYHAGAIGGTTASTPVSDVNGLLGAEYLVVTSVQTGITAAMGLVIGSAETIGQVISFK